MVPRTAWALLKPTLPKTHNADSTPERDEPACTFAGDTLRQKTGPCCIPVMQESQEHIRKSQGQEHNKRQVSRPLWEDQQASHTS